LLARELETLSLSERSAMVQVTADLMLAVLRVKLPRFGGQYRTRLQGVDWIFGLS